MKKLLIPGQILIFYDGPQLFVGSDQIGTQYVCLLSETSEEYDRFLCAPISFKHLSDFKSGNLDLREIFVHPETGELYTANVKDGTTSEIALEPIGVDVPPEWLPDEGFVYEEDLPDNVISQEAYAKNRGIIYLALNPPEARGEDCKIDSVTFADSVKAFQNLVKFAYKKALLSARPEFRKQHEAADNYELEIYAYSKGSFKVHMQSKSTADLSSNVELFRAMTKIDELLKGAAEAEAIEVLKLNKGHLIVALKNFLRLIVEKDVPLYYEWTTPRYREGFKTFITKANATTIYELLSHTKELEKEQIELSGEVTKIDIKAGLWTIVNEDDMKPYSGRLDKDSQVMLSGITAGGVRYRFICEERIEEETVSGKEKAHYFLISHEII